MSATDRKQVGDFFNQYFLMALCVSSNVEQETYFFLFFRFIFKISQNHEISGGGERYNQYI